MAQIHLIGNAHLDPIWLWRWQEGCGEVLQTFRSAVDRLKEYDGFIFTCSSASYYKWVEEIDPELFEEIKKYVKEGRFIPVNGWWVQADCNIPSGESFARQALYAQLYYYEKFGIICRTGYNVDSFGHNGNLPQLLFKGGMRNYVFNRPGLNENPDVPEICIWESQDGSKVLTYHLLRGYAAGSTDSIKEAIDFFEDRIDNDGKSRMLFYGVGNHGGGPTRGTIEYLIKNQNRAGKQILKFSNPDKYFDELRAEMPDLPIWKKDFQHHASGCYSVTSIVKQLNRQAENSLFASELFATIAGLQYNMKEKTEAIKEAWENVCFNQFHDIICGCSIMDAYEDVKHTMGYAMTISDNIYNEAMWRIAKKIDTWVDGVADPVTNVRNRSGGKYPRPVVVFNPLSYSIQTPVSVFKAGSAVFDSEKKAVPFQNIRAARTTDDRYDTCFLASVPSCGYAVYWVKMADNQENPEGESMLTDIKAEKFVLENEYIKVVFSDKTGFIISLIDKKTGYDYASSENPLAIPVIIDDSETDTWAHDVFQFHKKKGIMKLKSIKLIERGPIRAVIRIIDSFNDTELHQDFILESMSKTLKVSCKTIWKEKFTILKMSFPVKGSNFENTYEIPADFIKKEANGDEEPAERWGAISFTDGNKKHSLAVLNDSKYSYDSVGNDFRITLLRNVIFADHYSSRPDADFDFTDEGKQFFTYGIFLSDGDIEKSDVVNEAGRMNVHPAVIQESYHKGKEKQVKSFVSCNKNNIILTALKFCEDGSDDIIMRFYETRGKETRVDIIFEVAGAAFSSDFLPHEIKTFRIDKNGKVTETDFLEGIAK